MSLWQGPCVWPAWLYMKLADPDTCLSSLKYAMHRKHNSVCNHTNLNNVAIAQILKSMSLGWGFSSHPTLWRSQAQAPLLPVGLVRVAGVKAVFPINQVTKHAGGLTLKVLIWIWFGSQCITWTVCRYETSHLYLQTFLTRVRQILFLFICCGAFKWK